VLTSGTLAYLGSLPFGWLSYREYQRRSRESMADAAPASASAPTPQPAPAIVRPAENEDRPSRLN
jgi:CDP-diacylglycerol---serine O-phosphatidyltransferase